METGDRTGRTSASNCWKLAIDLALERRQFESVQTDRPQLRPILRLMDLMMIGIGSSVGAGAFVIVGVIAHPVGPASCFSFLLAAFSSMLTALCFAELAGRMPIAGSVYVYSYVAFGKFIAILCIVNLLIDYHIGAGLSVQACAAYIAHVMPGTSTAFSLLVSTKLISVALPTMLTAALCIDVQKGMKQANGLLVITKIAIIVIVIAVGISHMRTTNWLPFFPHGVEPIFVQAPAACFAFIGFGTVANAAEESANPQRDLPRAICASVVLSCLVYVALVLVLCGIVPYNEIGLQTPLLDAFGRGYANMPWVQHIINLGAMVGICTSVLTGLYSQARMYLALSRDKILCESVGLVSSRFGTPIRAQILCGVLAGFFATCFPTQILVCLLCIGVLASYSVVCSAVLVLRSQEPRLVAIWSFVLTVVSVIATNIGKTVLASNQNVAVKFATSGLLVLLVFAIWRPLSRATYSAPSTFACPMCPLLPLAGLTVNGGLLACCDWRAWARFGATTVLVSIGFFSQVARRPHNTFSQPLTAPPN